MTPQNPIYCFTITFILLSSLTATADAQVERENRSWHENTFGVLRDRVRDQQDMNLLVFPGAKLENVTGVDNIALLTDGEVGIYGGEGRAAVNGNPSTIRYYLGKAQKIREIILYSGNIDSRSNQDFEIRLANNAAHPGTEPDFPKEPTLTSGDRIIGSNSGAFMTRFFDASGKALSDAIGGENAKFDWIEFRLWRTYPSKVGDPAKAGNKSAGWASYLELQVLGDPDDPNLFADEQERHRWLEARDRERFERHLKKTVGDDVVAALEHPESLRRAIDDLAAKFPDRYDAETFTERYDTVVTALTDAKTRTEEQRNRYIELVRDFARLRKEG